MMTNEKLQKLTLLIAGIGLIPIALGYGLMPEQTLTALYGFDASNVNLKHIMRAIMGLYFAQSILWFLGFAYPKFRKPAIYGMVVFMLGLAGGRVLSLTIDGRVHWLLIAYLFLELFFGFLGLRLIITDKA
ncbi:DUF4345 domain-containing protein [Algibacter mikhailovii]|uniref:DUF4345 domain-containing protein n=1 Tax=Algibacter mikhailovii TaxID=425498 RepID=UPI00249484A4|nr:DUF4345 domain-containing protein [Algibacter mikhailovii]